MGWFGRTAVVLVCLSLAASLLAQELPVGSLRGHFELVPLTVTGLSAPDSAMRARACFVLGQIGSRKVAGQVRPLLRDPSRAVRYQAGIALCGLNDPAGLPGAGAALASAAEWVRYYAVGGLQALGTDRARQALRNLRPGQPQLISGRIEEALGTLPGPAPPPLRSTRSIGPYRTLDALFEAACDALVVESDGYWHDGDYLQCVRCNEAATFLDPHYVDLYGNSGWLLWSMGINDRALSVLRQGVAANPKEWAAWFNLGYQYVLMKDYRKATRSLRQAVELGAPATSYRQYCHALEKAGRPELALKEWQGLLETYPDDPIAPRQIDRLQRVLKGEEPPSPPGGDSARRPDSLC